MTLLREREGKACTVLLQIVIMKVSDILASHALSSIYTVWVKYIWNE